MVGTAIEQNARPRAARARAALRQKRAADRLANPFAELDQREAVGDRGVRSCQKFRLASSSASVIP
jgi:hypothetical protein